MNNIKNLFFALAILLPFFSIAQPMVLIYEIPTTSNKIVHIPLGEGWSNNDIADVTIDWGDGSELEICTIAKRYIHVYDIGGTYTITIEGTLSRFGDDDVFNDEMFPYAGIEYLKEVVSFGDLGLTSLNSAFAKATSLVSLPETLPSTVTDLGYALNGTAIFNGDLSDWDVRNVTNMTFLFCYGNSFNGDITNWNTRNVTNMEYMFYQCYNFNQDISNWDVSSVVEMKGMLAQTPLFNQNIGDWDVSSVTEFAAMLASTGSFDQNLGRWDISNDESYFDKMPALQTIANYDSILLGWAANPELQNNGELTVSSLYSSIALEAHNHLVNDLNWELNDFGMLEAPYPITYQVTDITGVGATLNGAITPSGSQLTITDYGFCWSTDNIPFVNDEHISLGANPSAGQFEYLLQNAEPKTTYTVRSYVEIEGVTLYYGQIVSFTTGEQKVILPKGTIELFYGDEDLPISATATSGLPVTITTTNSEVATIVDGKIHPVDVGYCLLIAIQPGNEFYTADTAKRGLAVDPRPLEVVNTIALDKFYDSTTEATLENATLTGVLFDDQVQLANADTGSFATPEIGENIPVTTFMTLTGTEAYRYHVLQPQGLVADIKDDVAVEILLDSETTIYPNPTTGLLHIEGDNITQIKIFNIEGNCCFIKEGKSLNQINLEDLPQGVYLLEVKNRNGFVVRRVVKL